MTKFGWLLSELMDKRGMDTAELAAALAKQGYEVNEETLVEYMQSKREIDPVLPEFLVEALVLDFEEQMELALAFTFGQT